MGAKKKLGVALLILIGLTVAATRFGQLQQFLVIVSEASLPFLGFAVIFRLGFFAANAASYRSALQIVEESVPFTSLLKLAFFASLVRITVPSAGLSGNVFLVKAFTDRGVSTGKGTTAVILSGFAFYVAFFSMLAFGITYLSVLEKLSLIQSVAAAVFAFAAFASLYYVVFTTRERDRLQRHAHMLRSWCQKVKYIPPADVTVFANDLYEGRQAAEQHGTRIVVLVFLKFLKEFFNAVALYMIVLAFHAPIPFLAVLVAYAVASTLSKLFLVPGGIGTYETLMMLAFGVFMIPVEYGLAVTLTFRVLTFWLPMMFGPFLVKEIL